MRFIKTLMAGAIGLSMATAPVLAQSAMPLSVSAMAQDDGEGATDASAYAIPAIVIIAVLGGAILLTSDDEDDFGNPVSP